MTVVVFDGKTLAADSYVFEGKETNLITKKNFNKITKVNDFVFSLAGAYAEYFSLKQQLNDVNEFPKTLKLDGETEGILFYKHEPKYYWILDSTCIYKESMHLPSCFGAAKDYAQGIIDAGHDAEIAVKLCIKNHAATGGRCNVLGIRKYFKWKTK